jgi:hypothetical protein
MLTKAFDFVEKYRLVDPSASREIVAARESAFRTIKPQATSTSRIHDLCRLAFQLPFDDSNYAVWFTQPIKDTDPHFVLAQDAAEAGRMATMILHDLTRSGSDKVAICILATSFAGRRNTFDNGAMLTCAREQISKSALRPKMRAPSDDIVLRASAELKASRTALDQTVSAQTIRAVLDGSFSETVGSIDLINTAYQSLREDSLRLADEVDMLWWHIGDWSYILDVPRSSISAKSLPLVSGIDLGAMVKDLPGPYGVYGIINRTLGKASEKLVSIIECVEGLSGTQLSKLVCKNAPDVFPLHTAMALAAGGGDWKKTLKDMCPEIADLKLPQKDMATQAYRERTSITYAGLET